MIDQGAKRLVRWEDGCVVVPGKIRCAKCNFALVRTNLYMQSGTTGPGNNETEPCPNGCGPLWPVTWEQEAREAYAVVERYFDEAQALRRAVQDAYGRLWCVNAEPMAPVPLYPPAAAARDARAILLAMLTKEQQAEAISKAREALGHNANWPNESRMTTTIGIDPGQRTGIAICRDGALCELRTVSPEQIESVLVEVRPELVVFEDSRKQSAVFSRGANPRAMLKIARNVGEIDQLCRHVEAHCDVLGIRCQLVSPRAKGRKLSSAAFSALLGWPGRSNQHERDAALVAWPYRRAL